MKVLTVRQPWAGLIACGLKDIENRSWSPCLSEGERFAIHAGRFEMVTNTVTTSDPDSLSDHPLCHRHGVVLCTVKLVEVTRDADSEWAVPGLFHWRLSAVRLVRTMPQVRGRLGLWEWPSPDVEDGDDEGAGQRAALMVAQPAD